MARIAGWALGAAALFAAVAAAYASELPKADRPDGAILYQRYCAGCHDAGPAHPGTMLLKQLGREHAPLVGRPDLDPAYVRAVVRNGLIEMPPFRPTELTEAQLDAVIAHINREAKPAR